MDHDVRNIEERYHGDAFIIDKGEDKREELTMDDEVMDTALDSSDIDGDIIEFEVPTTTGDISGCTQPENVS
jgi:hypothetical protein